MLAAGNYGDILFYNLNKVSPVTIKSADASKPAVFSSIKFSSSKNLWLDGVNVQFKPSASTMSWSSGLEILGSTNIKVSNSDLVGGLAVNGVPESATSLDNTGNVIGRPVARGVSIRNSTGVQIVDSEIKTFFKGIVLDNSSGVTISNNDIHGLRGSPVSGSDVSNVVVTNNHLHDSNPWRYLTGGDHGDFVHFWTNPATQTTASSNITVSNNFIDQGQGAPLLGIYMDDNGNGLGFNNVKITDNVIFNNDGQGVRLENNHNAVVTDNSFIQSRATGQAPGVVFTNGTSGVTFTRNILSGAASATLGPDANGNLLLQRMDAGAANYYGKVFINALTIGATAADLAIIPSSSIAGKGYGSSLSVYSATSASSQAVFMTSQGVTDHKQITFNAGLSTLSSAAKSSSTTSSYSWDFGDGTKGSGANIVHNYAKVGDYSVTLTMKDAFGNISTSKHDLPVVDQYLMHIDFTKTGILETSAYASPFVGATSTSKLITTTSGTAYHLMGSNFFEAPEATADQIFNRKAFTLSFSLQRDSAGAGTGYILGVHDSWGIALNAKGELEFSMKNQVGTSYRITSAGANLANTSNHNIDVSFDSAKSIATIFVDGKSVGSGTVQGSTRMMASWGLAVGNPYGTSVAGKIGDISLIDYAKTSTQVTGSATTGTTTAPSTNVAVVTSPTTTAPATSTTTTTTSTPQRLSATATTSSTQATVTSTTSATSFATPSLGEALVGSGSTAGASTNPFLQQPSSSASIFTASSLSTQTSLLNSLATSRSL